MVHLTLAGRSEDGRRLRLVSDAGVEFTLDVDARLRAALEGEPDRTGQWETRMDSVLRPRDIQARIRAGETPESVAQAAQTTVERIMVYAGPVLAERAHVAERAQRSSVRRRAGEQAPAGARTLGDAVAGRLRGLDVDPQGVEWDASRREDGRWALTAAYASAERTGRASFTFDVPGNYVTLDDEDARWLVGEQVAAPAPARDDLEAARRRRRTAGPDEELPLGADALALVHPDDEPRDDDGTDESTVDLSETAARVRGGASGEDGPEERPESGSERSGERPDRREEEPTAPPDSPDAGEPPAKRPTRRGRRASVPSWDEIMFGGGGSD